ncbi:hypothetical protein RXV91_13440 [Lactiplantibacillus sp. DA1]|uniref:hypothetical protein n=1 Tax=Lactiplantibacillus sp. DA1 TaxID=3079857 RepID=UPI00292A630C|nr:hypothetical protein [Lactiplantibacillus sp. DA1]MDV0431873.1 hypothetical protein [Lactiplantibacillus sp. DA1]
MVLSRKNKKEGLGKRLWNSITEPIPDDDNDEQDNEQIPLAYDLKDSAASKADEAEAKSTVNIPHSTANSDSKKQPVDAVIEPKKVAQKAHHSATASQESTAQSATQTSATTKHAATSAIMHRGAAGKSTESEHASTKAQSPQVKGKTAMAEGLATASQSTTTATTSEVPMTRTARHASQVAASQATSDQSKSAAAKAPKSGALKAATSQATTPSSAVSKANPTANKQPTSATSKQQKVEKRIPADHIPPVARKQQPRIAVKGTEQATDDAQPELPLSREELYGDQQPNGGKQPDKPTMSRVARHGEQRGSSDEPTDDERDFSELEAGVKNPHLKKQPRRYNWKLMLAGVAILVVAAGGAFFMWNHGQATQAAARTNAEKIVSQIYTSSAQRDLSASASNATLTKLQNNIDNMKDSSEKTSLQKQHDTAAKMLTVRTSYQDLRNAKGLLKADVTMDTITKNQQRLTTTGLTSSKPYFAKKYDKLFKTTGTTVKKVVSYDAAFQKLYNKKNKLKASTPSTTVDKVLANLKAYRKKSQLADNDYRKLIADRKQLAKANKTTASSSSSSAYSYSEPESSSSSASSLYSESSADSSSSATYSYSSDTDTSSTESSTSTPSYSYSTDSHATTSNSDTTSSTTTGDTTASSTGYGDTTSTN